MTDLLLNVDITIKEDVTADVNVYNELVDDKPISVSSTEKPLELPLHLLNIQQQQIVRARTMGNGVTYVPLPHLLGR